MCISIVVTSWGQLLPLQRLAQQTLVSYFAALTQRTYQQCSRSCIRRTEGSALKVFCFLHENV